MVRNLYLVIRLYSSDYCYLYRFNGLYYFVVISHIVKYRLLLDGPFHTQISEAISETTALTYHTFERV